MGYCGHLPSHLLRLLVRYGKAMTNPCKTFRLELDILCTGTILTDLDQADPDWDVLKYMSALKVREEITIAIKGCSSNFAERMTKFVGALGE